MPLSQQRATVIDYLRAYGPMTIAEMQARTGATKRYLKRAIRGLSKEDCISLKDEVLRLRPSGYMAVGSFPARSE